MQDDFSQCLVLNTRMAARAVTRRADRKLRPFGVTAAQFNILGALRQQSGRSVTEIANSIAMDRTTLSRNLDVLERKGLVETIPAGTGLHGNSRLSQLTEKGGELFEQIVPEWRNSQAELRLTLKEPGFGEVLAALRQLSRI
ncbi:MarR family winged helix-turn-helix transcriptional regulator [Devosia nitrariae]|uniref:MarR family transcriptional regulator n=1 Tax=Devosia nitrariae TaxID=2071872 RepID=A0ABQ5WBA5_9HYPH|nr:MarR family transcriptional regulator [Devosia nitrariae]GLQ57369.1 MarR family transcriptional regulator [Devosia nitrariae]